MRTNSSMVLTPVEITHSYGVAKLDENLNGLIVIKSNKHWNGQIDSVPVITNNYHHLKCYVNVDLSTFFKLTALISSCPQNEVTETCRSNSRGVECDGVTLSLPIFSSFLSVFASSVKQTSKVLGESPVSIGWTISIVVVCNRKEMATKSDP